MGLEINECYRDFQAFQVLQDKCKKYLYYHVTLTMTDGDTLDGIIENVDGDYVDILVGEDVMEKENENDVQRQYHGYKRPRRFRRFRRRSLPISNLAALSLLAYPYIAQPPYPYYPYYQY
ncbi:hypothetical protein [Clostridium weizhouense]|uniref:Uncharacterized protein n=1 Tax=Clostridium weizhouense TaxID=2859781 RepID=A0ABS7APT4_9CLOT|nr:hypothetical protein [Clostridium weizhouense]MBW6410673.1 hypothetical protein [Clostridium weizhouense]